MIVVPIKKGYKYSLIWSSPIPEISTKTCYIEVVSLLYNSGPRTDLHQPFGLLQSISAIKPRLLEM